MQRPKEIILQYRPIPEVKLKDCQGFTIMRETGLLVTCAQKNKDEPYYLYFFTMQGKQIKRKLDCLCSHNSYHLLNIFVHNQEYLAVGCMGCQDIKLLNLKTHKVTKAFSARDIVFSMSNGESDRLYIHCSRKILELDCSDLIFKTIQTMSVDSIFSTCMFYVPSPHSLIIVTNSLDSKFEAMSTQSKKLVWKSDRIGGGKVQPAGCIFFLSHNTILVSDQFVNRIVAINPTDGSQIKTIPVEDIRPPHSLCLYNDQVFGVGYDDNERYCSFFRFSIN